MKPTFHQLESMSDASDFPTPAKTVRVFNDGTVYWYVLLHYRGPWYILLPLYFRIGSSDSTSNGLVCTRHDELYKLRAIPGWFNGHCDILAKPFPYDTHECFLMIGTSSSSNVVLQPLFENG